MDPTFRPTPQNSVNVAHIRQSKPDSGLGFRDLSERGTTRAEDAQGTPTQSHISTNTLVYENYSSHILEIGGVLNLRTTTSHKCAAVPRRARIQGP